MTTVTSRPPLMFVTLNLARGGTEGHIAGIAPRLVANGWPVTVYCLLDGGPLADELSSKGVQVVVAGKTWLRGRGVPNSVGALLSAPQFYQVLRKAKPGIVHFFLPAAYLVGAPMALAARVPVLIMSRRSQNDYQRGHPVAARIERRLHAKMTAVLGNSRRVVGQLIADERCDPAKTGLIYNGVALDKFAHRDSRAETRRVLGLTPEHVVIALVANLIPYKGHDDLLRGLARIKSQLPPSWTLLCVGRDDGIGASLAKLAADLGLAEHVKFLGSRADVPELLLASDLGVLASHEEGFSNAVLEGMAAGLPMIVTDVGGNAEAVLDGVTGYVVPPRDPESLGQAIARLGRDDGLARQMGDAGRARAEAVFSMGTCIAAYERLYQGLLTGGKAGRLAAVAR